MTLKQAQSDARHAHIALEKQVMEVRKLRKRAADAEQYEAAIRRHHTFVTQKNDWSADDALWAVLGLEWDRDDEVAA